jgi:hypothetical protein
MEKNIIIKKNIIMKKVTTTVSKPKTKSPTSIKKKLPEKVKSIARPPLKIISLENSKKSFFKADNSFWGGLVVVISGILALIIFLSLFFRFLLGLVLYSQLENEDFFIQENDQIINESKEIENSLEKLMDFSSTTDLPNELEVNSSEFMELPEGKNNLSDLNFVNSPDGAKFAYVVKNEENKYAVMLNDDLSSYYDEILFMVFSPDSKHFAYGAELENQRFVVIDGRQGQNYDWILLPRFFTPDSRHFVYKVRMENGDSFVFNEAEQKMYDQLYNPFISSDKKEMIYYARTGNKIYKNSLVLEKYEE